MEGQKTKKYYSVKHLEQCLQDWNAIMFGAGENQFTSMPLFSSANMSVYQHIILAHAVELIQHVPEHNLGVYAQQAFEATNKWHRYV
jgi:hypothetical protein